jgi:hypothetical protein
MRVGGWGAFYDMSTAALTADRIQLSRDLADLEYLMEKIKKLEELPTTTETWRDVIETWCSLLDLVSKISPERGIAVLESIASDDELLKAIGAGRALMGIVAEKPPPKLVSLINEKAGAKIRSSAYGHLRVLEKELAIIRRTKDHQERAVALLGTAIASVFISIGGLVARVYYDFLQAGSKWVWLFPVVIVLSIVMCALCIALTLFCLRLRSPRSKAE